MKFNQVARSALLGGVLAIAALSGGAGSLQAAGFNALGSLAPHSEVSGDVHTVGWRERVKSRLDGFSLKKSGSGSKLKNLKLGNFGVGRLNGLAVGGDVVGVNKCDLFKREWLNTGLSSWKDKYKGCNGVW